jgi:hypothetical protein
MLHSSARPGRSTRLGSPLRPVLDVLALDVLDLDLHAVLGEGYVALLHLPLAVRGEIVAVEVDLARLATRLSPKAAAPERVGHALGSRPRRRRR